MKVAVIGAGIVGVTTAYELAADGHEVSVFERHASVAEETSFANAGVVAPGYVTPWAAPGMPAKVLRYLMSTHAPVRVHVHWMLQQPGWAWRWWRACRAETYATNRARLQRLAFYSRERLHALSAELHLDYERAQGYLVLLREARDHAMVQPGLRVLRDVGVTVKELTAADARRIEPALNSDMALHGALHLPDDEVGNCRQFALLLKAEAQRLGAQFCFNQTICRVTPGPRPELSFESSQPSPQQFDAVVLCAGMETAALLASIGLHVPLAAVWGYSISAAIREPLNAPLAALMDERFKVAISRIGQRIRVAGSAELGGIESAHHPGALRTLYKVLNDWFPGAAHLNSHIRGNAVGAGVQVWKGARPMLPDGPPIVGPSGRAGIWVNMGHGSSGWALSCGSARMLADQLLGREPAIDLDGFGIERVLR